MKGRRSRAAIAASAFLLGASNSLASAEPQPSYSFDLPAEPLANALREVAVRTGRNLIVPHELVEAREAPALTGLFTAEQALARLLQGSGLRYRLINGSLIVEAIPATGGPVATASGASAITVTGTRIRGAGSASPVIVTSRHDLERAGVSDLADFTRILPQNYTGGQNRGIAGDGEQGGQNNINNSATLNLRGLGPDATLTLLNGHRLSYDAVDQGVDISAIPLSAIERIEVVSDGASALYGSDAVAGVANIILRSDYDGLEATARLGGATAGGDFQQQYSLVGGHRWKSGGFMIALDKNSATPIYADQRDFTRSLDPSLTLTDGNHELSGVLTAYQRISPILTFDIDSYATNRNSLSQSPFTPTQDVHVDGAVSRSHVRSYAITPSLRAEFGGWQASISATDADSRTFLDSYDYSQSALQHAHVLLEDRLKGAEATGEGPLVALPGGDARLAIGGGIRTVSLHDQYVILAGGQSLTARDFTETRNVQFAYGELSLPLVRPSLNVPLIDRLTVSAALRYEHWSRIAAVTTPKLGLIYEPDENVTIRATWGKSFKIPTLYQVNATEEADLIPGFIFSPPPQPAGSPVLLLGGSAPGLKPEHATTWSATLDLHPRRLPGLNVQATYFNVDYRDRIAEPLTSLLTVLYDPTYASFIVYNPTAAQVNAAIAATPGGLVNQTGAPFDASAVGAIIDGSTRNTERQRIHGLDLNANDHLDLGRGQRLLLSAAASYLENKQQLAPNQPLLPIAGTIFNPPHWRGRAGVTWEASRTDLSAFVNYVGSRIDNSFPNFETIAPFVTVDLNAGFRTGATRGAFRNVELRLSLLNVLDQKPHHARSEYPEGAPYDSTNESPVGRFIGGSIRKVWR